MESPLHLTFGVELEFFVRFYRDSSRDPYNKAEGSLWPRSDYGSEGQYTRDRADHNRIQVSLIRYIIEVLGNSGFKVNDYNVDSNFQKWTVTTDGSIRAEFNSPDEWDQLNFYGIEVKSPAFEYSNWALTQIQNAVAVINSSFNASVNTTCGLHVHVGNRDQGFPLQTLKNFGMLITAFERQISSLHPSHRIENDFCKIPTKVHVPKSPWQTALSINAIKDQERLVTAFNTCDHGQLESYFAYNFLNLQYTSLKTIEMRQHAGTLDPQAITNWAIFVSSLLAFAHDHGPSVSELIVDHVHDCKYTVLNLLRDLGLHDLATYYEQRGTYSHPRQDWEWRSPIERLFDQDMDAEVNSHMKYRHVVRMARGWTPGSAPALEDCIRQFYDGCCTFVAEPYEEDGWTEADGEEGGVVGHWWW